MEVLWCGRDDGPQALPCVDCGLVTGNYCDGGPAINYEDMCFASERGPRGQGNAGARRTALCSYCETLSLFCRFCRGVSGCTPPPTQVHWSGISPGASRKFTPDVRDRLIALEFERRVAASQARDQMTGHDADVSPKPVASDAAESEVGNGHEHAGKQPQKEVGCGGPREEAGQRKTLVQDTESGLDSKEEAAVVPRAFDTSPPLGHRTCILCGGGGVLGEIYARDAAWPGTISAELYVRL